MTAAQMQGPDGLVYEIDLEAAERVKELQEAVARLLEAVVGMQAAGSPLLSDEALQAIEASRETVAASLAESKAYAEAKALQAQASLGEGSLPVEETGIS